MPKKPLTKMCAGICNAEQSPSHCSLRFRKASHLRKHEEFQHIFDAGKQSFGRFITLWVNKESDAGFRIGVVATKRTFHDATQRNRAKRLIRESFRLLQPMLDKSKPWDIVVIARRAILDQKQQQVQEEMLALFKKQHIVVLEKKHEMARNSSN
jgi:ribonuclease P protein component